jgi:hypothetical protein
MKINDEKNDDTEFVSDGLKKYAKRIVEIKFSKNRINAKIKICLSYLFRFLQKKLSSHELIFLPSF